MFKTFDFFLFFRLLHPNYKKNGLKEWSKLILDRDLDKKYQKTDWLNVRLTEDLIKYMADDVIVLLGFLNYLHILEENTYCWFNTWTNEEHNPILTSIRLDQVLLPQFLKMYLAGVEINGEQLNLASQKAQQELLQCYETLGCTQQEFQSAQKLEDVLKESAIQGMDTCLDLWPRTGTNDQIKLSVDGVNQFLYEEQSSLSKECLQWFTNFFQTKEKKSVCDNIKKFQKMVVQNVIYPMWNICGAATGRVITSKPALNSTPRSSLFREMFIAPKGQSLIVCDYSMIEIFIIAVISQDETMLQNIYEGKDLHIFLASQVLEKPYEELMALKQTDAKEFKKTRTPMKSVNFGLLYGMGPDALWKRLIAQGHFYSPEEVRHIHETWTRTYPGIARYKERCRRETEQIREPIPVLFSRSSITSLRGRVSRERYAFTTSINFPIQGSCADILKTALRFFNKAQELNWIDQKVGVVLTAHDEIVFKCPTNQVEQVEKQVTALMESVANKILQQLNPQIECHVESGVGNNWAAKP